MVLSLLLGICLIACTRNPVSSFIPLYDPSLKAFSEKGTYEKWVQRLRQEHQRLTHPLKDQSFSLNPSIGHQKELRKNTKEKGSFSSDLFLDKVGKKGRSDERKTFSPSYAIPSLAIPMEGKIKTS